MDKFTSKARRDLVLDLATDNDAPNRGYCAESLARVITNANVADLIGESDSGDYVTEALAQMLVNVPALVALAVRGREASRDTFWAEFTRLLRIELARELLSDVELEQGYQSKARGPVWQKRGYDSLRDMQFDEGMAQAKARREGAL